jgi:type VI secretion system ImpM family protein
VSVRWFAFGKHPSFADFFSVGEHSQLTLAYKNWVVRGYEKYLRTHSRCREGCAYRFWSKGSDQDLLAIGLLQSSVDSVGRCFPLLLIGIAALPSWQKQWRSLQQQLEGAWVSLEEAAAGFDYKAPRDIIMVLEKRRFPALSLTPCHESAPSAFFTGRCADSNLELFLDRPLATDDFLLLFRG